jgi:hypothetical protein
MDESVDLERILSRLAESSDRIVANPADIDRLRGQGIKFEEAPKRTIAESVDILFASKKKHAIDRAKLLPPTPQMPYAIMSLYEEIVTCIIFGVYGAAITLSGVLVEFVLKFVTYGHEAGGYSGYDPKHWDEFEEIPFGAAIGRAKKAGLINPTQVTDLERFKNIIRNPYNHYNIRKITSAVVWGKVQIVNLETGAVEEKTIEAKDDPVIQAQSKPFVDEEQVFRVFGFADAVTRALLVNVK